mmetsp:Transcript_54807/g.119923  ORF Transcript_54807/g.119923 Transcript_54807/m.119923 type:complete len:357 (-) Transcript_54807:68-1138(-)
MDARIRHPQRPAQGSHGLRHHLRGLALPQDVHHHGAAHAQVAVAQGQTQHRTEVLFELVHTTGFHGVVSRVVRARSDLIQQHLAILQQEHLNAKNAACVVKALDGISGHLLCQFLLLLGHTHRWRQTCEAHAVALHGVHHGVSAHGHVHGLIDAASHHHGQFHLKGRPLLHIELLPIVAAQFLPGRWDRRRIGHHGVAPAVVGTKAALEHHGETKFLSDAVQLLFAVNLLEVRQRNAVLLQVDLLVVLVLDQLHNKGKRLHGDALLMKFLQNLSVHVFHLQRQNVALAGELPDLFCILKATLHRQLRHLPRGAVFAQGVQDAHAHPQAVGSVNHHATQLTSSQAAHGALVHRGEKS